MKQRGHRHRRQQLRAPRVRCQYGGDVGLELADGRQEFAHVRSVCFESFRIELQVADFLTGTVRIAMPEMPFNPAEGFKDVLPGLLMMVFDALGELTKNSDAHGDVEPVQNMFACRRDHLGNQVTDPTARALVSGIRHNRGDDAALMAADLLSTNRGVRPFTSAGAREPDARREHQTMIPCRSVSASLL